MQWCHQCCHQYHVRGNMLLPCTCQKEYALQILHIYPHMPISSSAHMRQQCQYICLIKTHLLSTMWPGTLVYIHFILLAYAPEKYTSHITHICPTALLLWYTYDFTLMDMQVKKNNKNVTCNYYVIVIYVPVTNVPQMLHMQIISVCIYQTTMSVYICHMN